MAIFYLLSQYLSEICWEEIVEEYIFFGEYVLWSRRGLVRSVLAYLTKSQGSSPRPDIKTKYEKYFFGDFLSQQISGKNSESK